MLEVIKKLVVMIDEEIQLLVHNKDEKKEYIKRINNVGSDDIEVLKQVSKIERTLLDYEGELVELYDYRQSLGELQSIALQSNCTKDNQTFSGFLSQFGPQPEKYRLFNELLGKGWADRMNKIPNNTAMWDNLELIMAKGADNE